MTPSSTSVSSPDPDLRQELVETLRRLEKDPGGDEKQRHLLQNWLERPERDDHGKHLDLKDLQTLARRREQQGRRFKLPEHLHSCRMCMELFQVIHGETESGSAAGSSDRRPSKNSPTTSTEKQVVQRIPHRLFIWALAVLMLGGLSVLLYRPPTMIIESGALQTQDTIRKAGKAPARTLLQALQPTHLTLLDGSTILLEPGTRFRLGKTLSLQPTLTLLEGRLEIHLTDEATPWTLITPEEIYRAEPVV